MGSVTDTLRESSEEVDNDKNMNVKTAGLKDCKNINLNKEEVGKDDPRTIDEKESESEFTKDNASLNSECNLSLGLKRKVEDVFQDQDSLATEGSNVVGESTFKIPTNASFQSSSLIALSPQTMKKELQILHLDKPKFSIGRSLDTTICIRDVNISRLHVEFQFEFGHWSLTNHSSNGVTVNSVRSVKGQPMSLKHGDEVVLSDLPKLYSWTMQLDQPTAKRRKLEEVRIGEFGGKEELVNRISQQRKDHERRMYREKVQLENAMKAGERRLAGVIAEKEFLVSRLEEQAKQQKQRDQEARDRLAEEGAKQGEEERERSRQKLEERLDVARKQEEVNREELIEDMERKIKEEEVKRQKEVETRDTLLVNLNKEKANLEKKFETDKAELERELKKLQDKINEQDLSTEAKETQWNEKLSVMSKDMENRLSEERDVLAGLVDKEKGEKEKLVREVEEQKLRNEEELETERATHAAQLEMFQEEKERFEEELRLRDAEIELKRKEQEEERERTKERLVEIERKKEEFAKEVEAEREDKAAKAEEENAILQQSGHQGRKELLDQLEETLESQYQCPTCLELFISPVSLNCGHTYCWLCLAQWKATSGRTRGDLGTCPQCRLSVQHENRVFAIDHMIEALVAKFGPDKQKDREEKVQERRQDEQKFKDSNPPLSAIRGNPAVHPVMQRRRDPSGPPTVRGRGGGRGGRGRGFTSVATVELSSSDEDQEESDESDSDTSSSPENSQEETATEDSQIDSDALDSHVPGTPGALYGGFGRCYKCNRRGHWTAGCPL